MANTEERLRKIIQTYLDPREPFTRESHLFNDLGADSLDTVEVIMACEDEFGIEITDAQAEGIETFGQLVDLITAEVGS